MIPLKDDNPTFTTPYVTVTLIAVNCLVFLYQFVLGHNSQWFILSFGAIPYEITHFFRATFLLQGHPPFHPEVPLFITPISHMFLHGGLFHLLSNMLYLWIFGNNVEDRFGHFPFLVFYVGCGLVALSTQVWANPHSQMPMIGASGAIAGVLGSYLVMFPRARVLTLVILVFFVTLARIPAVVFLVIWFIIQLLSAHSTTGNVAWFAHLGGFIAGFILTGIWAGRKYNRRGRYPFRYRFH